MKSLIATLALTGSMTAAAMAASASPPEGITKAPPETETAQPQTDAATGTAEFASSIGVETQSTVERKAVSETRAHAVARTKPSKADSNRQRPTLRDDYLPPPWKGSARSLSRVHRVSPIETERPSSTNVETPASKRTAAEATAKTSTSATATSSASASDDRSEPVETAPARSSSRYAANVLNCGLTVQTASPSLVSHVGPGVLVLRVSEGSVASRIGLKQFDLIQTVGDRQVNSSDGLAQVLNQLPLDNLETIQLVRTGVCQKLHVVTSSEKPAASLQTSATEVDGQAGVAPQEKSRQRSISISCSKDAGGIWKMSAVWLDQDGKSKRCDLQGPRKKLEQQIQAMPADVASRMLQQLGADSHEESQAPSKQRKQRSNSDVEKPTEPRDGVQHRNSQVKKGQTP